MTLPRLCLACALLAVGLTVRPAAADDSKSTDPAKKADPNVTVRSTPVGDVTGEVVKVEKGTITLKVPEVVQTGVSRSRGRVTPRLGMKTAEVSYPLADKVVVKTVSGKEADLDAVKEGGMVALHVSQVKESRPGEKATTRLEVKRIDVPNPTTDATAKKK